MFRPQILQNIRYCECFQASIVCTDRCRCSECKNNLESAFLAKPTALKSKEDHDLPTENSADEYRHDMSATDTTETLYDKLIEKVMLNSTCDMFY